MHKSSMTLANNILTLTRFSQNFLYKKLTQIIHLLIGGENKQKALPVLKLMAICSFYFQPIVIDARGHLLGRLASIVAKTCLQGKTAIFWLCW